MEFLLNGRETRTEGYAAHLTLLDFLRAQGLTGAKEGCAEGECGACTVVVVRPHGSGSAFVPINSCLLPLSMAAGQEIYTVEALAAAGPLEPAQQALANAGGSQCGYCTPGFVMSLFAEHYRPGRQGPCEIESLGGNLCRCTGYRPIAEAAQSLVPPPDGQWRERLKQPAPKLGGVCEEGFSRPETLAACLDLLERDPEARIVAGATDLAVESNLKGRRFRRLVSVEALPELRVFRQTDETLEIGAGLPLSEIAARWTDAPPVFREWLPLFASPPIRNRATLGGNLATASPIGDAAPLLLALDARVKIASAGGWGTIALEDFFIGYRRTALEPGELLVSVVVPKDGAAFDGHARFFKIAKRRVDDISSVAACFAVALDEGGHVESARFAYGGVAATPIRAYEAEGAVLGRVWNETTVHRAQDVVARALRPMDDHRASAAYRLAMAQSLLEKFWWEQQQAPGEPDRRHLWSANSRRNAAVAGQSVSHESAPGHVTGEALYTDDLCGRFARLLHAWPVTAPHAHAIVKELDVLPALAVPGVITTLTAADVPGENDTGANRHDEPLFPAEVMYHSQPVAWVLAESLDAAQRGAAQVRAVYDPLPAVVTLRDAVTRESFHSGPIRLQRGDADAALAASPHKLEGELEIGGQEHFYLETHSAIAWLDESGGVALHSSTQHPAETQDVVARVLGVPRNAVTVECLRMGGAFGGKESQASPWAALAALGARKTGRPVRVRLTRALDMALSGKRHPFLIRYRAGFDDDGRLESVVAMLYSDAGWSLDLSEPVMGRALFHLDNAYYLPAVRATGYVCKTNKTSQTAFRGFGGPQGMLVVEEILDRVARRLSLPPEVVRERNLYREGHTTHYGQPVKDAGRIAAIWHRLLETSQFAKRRLAIEVFNRTHPHRKRGLAITPVKFGISFTATVFNQAAALVLVYRDGSVQVNHGGTEMGQGLFTKIGQIAAEALGLPPGAIRMMPTRTDKVPNTSPSAASASTDLNGAAVVDACARIRERLAPVAASMLGCAPEVVSFAGGFAAVNGGGGERIPFADVTEAAYRQRIPLIAEGFYRTPEIHFDPKTGQGRPFHYFAFGAAVAEVEVDGFTGDYKVRRADLLEDVGDSLSPLIDRGQIEGGFVQGLGWLTLEELLWDAEGRLTTAGASTYKLPSWSELPGEFHVDFLERATEPGVVMGSKAVGEPPLMLAISAREALRDAIAAFGPGGEIPLASPLTPERVFHALEEQRARLSAFVPPDAGVVRA